MGERGHQLETDDGIKVILANPLMIKAFKKGHPK
jgi:hypothetical protein